MLRSVVICPDRELAGRLTDVLDETGAVSILRTIDKYPSAPDLTRALRSHAAEILFLSFERLEKALEVVRLVEHDASHVQVVAVHRVMDPVTMRESMRAGVREFLVDPFEHNAVWESLSHLKDLLERRPAQYESTTQIFTFFPSKAGSGASTTALNVSAAASRKKDMHVLLSDFDLTSGMVRFMLKLESLHSVPEACERCNELDDSLWPQLITSFKGLDILHAGRINPHIRIEPAQVRTLLDFMRRNYQALFFDVSGNLERYSLELMQESKRILVVCTPEIPSLHQAREKMGFLKELELDSRVSIILNRVSKRTLFTAKQVSEIVGAPVLRSFPNDYLGVSRAMTEGALIDPGSELGKAYSEFAASLIDQEPVPDTAPAGKRKFLEFLTMPQQTGLTRINH